MGWVVYVVAGFLTFLAVIPILQLKHVEDASTSTAKDSLPGQNVTPSSAQHSKSVRGRSVKSVGSTESPSPSELRCRTPSSSSSAQTDQGTPRQHRSDPDGLAAQV